MNNIPTECQKADLLYCIQFAFHNNTMTLYVYKCLPFQMLSNSNLTSSSGNLSYWFLTFYDKSASG